MVEKLRFSNIEDFANSLDDATIETVLVVPCSLGDAQTVTLGRVRQAHKAVKTALLIAAERKQKGVTTSDLDVPLTSGELESLKNTFLGMVPCDVRS